MKKLFTVFSLTFGLLLFFGMSAFAQQSVSGKVTDTKSNEPLVGAKVVLEGSNIGAYTGANGEFKLNTPSDQGNLVVSYLGYVDQVVPIDGQSSISIGMESGAFDMDEVVVVGYGTVKKRDLTGAVSTVGADDFNTGMISSPDQAIQGKVPGVYIINNSGQPGSGASIRIRGNSSVRSGNNPLWVVDGVPLSGGTARPQVNAQGLGNTPDINPMIFFNPNDIADISILKDASATAIYGSRGANGVILVSTKKGRAGVPRITFSGSLGTSSILNKFDVLDATEYRAAQAQYGITTGDFGGDENALDAILQTGISQNYHVGISGGSSNGNYRVGIGYFDQEGIIQESELKKYTGNMSGSWSFLDDIVDVDVSLFLSQVNEEIAPISNDAGFTGNLIGQALQWFPTRSLRLPDGSFDVELGSTTINPLAYNAAYTDGAQTTNILGSIAPRINFTDELSYRFQYSTSHQLGNRETTTASWINVQGIEGRGWAVNAHNTLSSQQFTHTLNYNKDLSDNFSLNATAGYEYLSYKLRGRGFGGYDFPTDSIALGNIFQTTSQGSRAVGSFENPTNELQSYFARAAVNIADRFLVTGTIRADGSTKFGKNNRYGIFPSFAAAWNLHNEDFLSGGLFDNLKLRAGWGVTGNSEFPSGAALERFGLFPDGGAGQVNVANPDLRWETSTTINVGLDFSIINSRLTGSIDYFNRNTSDILVEFFAIQPAPASRYWQNIDANIINSGVELGLNAFIIGKENLSWEVGVNAAYLKNQLTNFTGSPLLTGNLNGQGISNATSQVNMNDKPLNTFSLPEYLGLDENGLSTYGDINTDSNPNPDVLLGFSTKLKISKFTAFLNFNGAFGHQLYNNTANSVIPIGNLNSGRNVASSLIGTTPPENLSNAIARSTRYLESGNYLKFNNLNLSYDLGNFWKVENARIFLTGQNLYVFTGFTGFDPEVNVDKSRNGVPSFGIEYIPYPSARTILAGIQFSL